MFGRLSLSQYEFFFHSLCHNRWGKVSAYDTGFASEHSYKQLYMILDNGTLTFTADPHEVSLVSLCIHTRCSSSPPSQGVSYLVNAGVLEDSPVAIAGFIHHTTTLDWASLRQFLHDRHDVLDSLIELHSYDSMFLPDALRKFFSLIPAPTERGQFLETLLERFSKKYIQCNKHLSMDKGWLMA